MAAAIIPIATTIVPLVLPWIVKLMDKIFGSKTGATKLATGTAVAQQIFAALQKILAAQGVSLPVDAAEIQQLLQSVVSDLNSKGELQGANTVMDPTPVVVTSGGGAKGNATLASLLLDTASALLKA